MFKLVSLLLLIYFTGCATKQPQIEIRQTVPKWYSSPKISNNTTLYAIGEGKTKKESILDALSQVMATLNVTLSSEFQSNSTIQEGEVNTQQSIYTYNLNSKVKKIEISNYTILHSQKLGYKRYATEIAVDKKELFNSLLNRLHNKISLLQLKSKEIQKLPAIKEYFAYNSLIKESNNIENILHVMYALNKKFSTQPYHVKLNTITAKREELHQKFHIVYKYTKKEQGFITVLQKSLLNEGMKQSTHNDKYKLILSLKTTTNKKRAYGFFIAQTTLFIQLKGINNKLISSNLISVNGQSTSNFKDANRDVVFHFKKLLKKKGIWHILGIKNTFPTK